MDAETERTLEEDKREKLAAWLIAIGSRQSRDEIMGRMRLRSNSSMPDIETRMVRQLAARVLGAPDKTARIQALADIADGFGDDFYRRVRGYAREQWRKQQA